MQKRETKKRHKKREKNKEEGRYRDGEEGRKIIKQYRHTFIIQTHINTNLSATALAFSSAAV